jgi:tetratricopeptide (TPR) repeat protein
LLDSGNAAYSHDNLNKAITFYSGFLNEGYESAEAYYNLGNCYYRQNDMAKAILNYEKALKLAPSDPDIQFNLQLANQKTTDRILSDSPMFFTNKWKNFVNTLSEKGWAMLSILFLILSLTLFALYLTGRILILRQFSFWFGIVFIALSFSSFLLARTQYNLLTTHNTGIIITPGVTVRAAPNETSLQLFLIHEGAKVWVLKTEGAYLEVKLANGNQGWMPAADLILI